MKPRVNAVSLQEAGGSTSQTNSIAKSMETDVTRAIFFFGLTVVIPQVSVSSDRTDSGVTLVTVARAA